MAASRLSYPIAAYEDEVIARADARESLIRYCEYVQPGYMAAAPHRALAERLEAVERGDITRLLVTEPPQHGKSRLVSVHFPCWYLGRNPDKRVVQTSYGLSLALKHSRVARDFFVSQEFHNVFPGVRHQPGRISQEPIQVQRQAAQEWGTARGGSYYAVGIGGGLTGMGFDLGIIDDPVKDVVEANSEVTNERNWEWYGSVFRTRMSPAAAIILTMTRWSKKDLMQKILDQISEGATGEDWEILHMPALAFDNNPHDPTGRSAGMALWPERYDLAWLANQKISIGSKAFEALYQGNPTIGEGELFKRSWWKFYSTLPSRFDGVVQSWDCTFKDLKTSDYVVGQVWGWLGADNYLLDQIRGKMNMPVTMQAIRSLSAKWPLAAGKLIEDKANGPAVIQMLQHEIPGLIPIEPHGGKIVRAQAATPAIEAGNVYLPEARIAPWVHDFVEEHAAFPNGRNDDQVDCTTQYLNWRISRIIPQQQVYVMHDDYEI